MHNLETGNQEDTLKSNMVEPAWAVYSEGGRRVVKVLIDGAINATGWR